MPKRALLTIDGGGIRGILPLCALIELEKQLQKPARDVFALMAGTSTGAIICGGLARGLSAQKLLELYQKLGHEVFRFDLVSFALDLGSFRYRIKPVFDLLQRYLGDAILNELPVDIMVSATRVSDGKPWYFVRDNPSNSGSTGSLRLVDCITASVAAPTYFEPYEVPGIGVCVDGGVGIAGNPVYQACVEAFYYTPASTYAPADTYVVSLGTGVMPNGGMPHNLIDWVNWVVGEFQDIPAEQQTELVMRHFQTAGTTRINPPLPRNIAMDDSSAVDELIRIGREFAAHLNWKAILEGQMALPPRRPLWQRGK
ncbi:MAG: patatin-like phospholipase family protein [Chloroflexi bacterium]|nr:patatin-like phospholipase family protein [Chloroflexota bacterium]MCL5276100.1 patatin-like phospholipase family protein [Chloroflexota bacterium]